MIQILFWLLTVFLTLHCKCQFNISVWTRCNEGISEFTAKDPGFGSAWRKSFIHTTLSCQSVVQSGVTDGFIKAYSQPHRNRLPSGDVVWQSSGWNTVLPATRALLFHDACCQKCLCYFTTQGTLVEYHSANSNATKTVCLVYIVCVFCVVECTRRPSPGLFSVPQEWTAFI